MAFKVVRGKYKVQWLPFTASLALAKGKLLEWTSGYLAEADDNDTDIVGILDRDVASTDADYAVTGKLVPVIVPESMAVIEADTADTYVAATHQGVECGIDTSATVDLDDTTNKVFRPIGPGSAALKVQGYLKINGRY